jgi:hypothetical protein
MLELKVIRTANKLYRGLITLGLRSLNRKDKANLREYNNNLTVATDYRNLAVELRKRADSTETKATKVYDEKARAINAAYNTLQNARDDLNINV